MSKTPMTRHEPDSQPSAVPELFVASAAAYHKGRALNGVIGAVLLASVGLALPWWPGVVFAIPAVVITLLSYRQAQRTTVNASLMMLIDVIFVAMVVVFVRPPAAMMIGPITVMALASMLLMPWYRTAAVAATGVAISAVGLLFDSPFALPLTNRQSTLLAILVSVTYVPGFYVFLRRGNEVLAEREMFNRQLHRRMRYQKALASCSQALLSSNDDVSSLDAALEILLDVLHVDAVVVARNVADDQDGLCREVRRVVNYGVNSPVVLGLTRMPWSRAPQVAARLAAGETYFYPRDAGSDEEHAMFSESHIVSDMIIPIKVNERWDGYLSFTDGSGAAEWDEVDLDVLPSIARMVGAYWQREDAEARLEGLIAAKDEFVASVSHELRTPLTAVVGFADELRALLESQPLDETRELVDLVAEQSREVANIVEDLLVVTRLESDSLALAMAEACLADEVRRVIKSIGMDVGVLETTADRTEASVDAGRFRQIVRNLLTNAQRYGGPTVRCTVEETGDSVVVTVLDDGAGIPESLWEQVFEPYRSAVTSTTNPSSVGLGLTVSRRLARLMGGELVYAYDGTHSAFTLSIPKNGSPSSAV